MMRQIWKQDPQVLSVLRAAPLRPGRTYRWSQYALSFEEGGAGYLCSFLTRECLACGLEPGDRRFAAEEIAGNKDLSYLAENRFLVPEDADEYKTYEGLLRILRALDRPEGLTGCTILPTLKCNARCVYCYEAGREETSMSPDTADHTAAYILQHARRSAPVRLHWFGGEPLLRPDIIDRICQRLREEGLEYHSAMTSNGSLITEELADRLVRDWRLESIQIALDGPEEEYIRRKAYPRYRDYYRAVPRSAAALAARGVRVTLRINTDRGNAASIPEFLRELSDLIPDKTGVKIYFCVLNEERARPEAREVWDRIFEADSLIERYGFLPDYNRRLHRFKTFNCMADNTGRSVLIAPDGLLYSCEMCLPGTSFGNVWEGVTDRALFDRLSRPEPAPDKCRSCPLLPECTPFTGCPVRDYDCFGLTKRHLIRSLKLSVRSISDARDTAEDRPCGSPSDE
ncbi:MAG: radical SAM protein [Abditibacteriota bacterium]|nr:radical SAM protein [Abditibacteriota bacterium]